MVDDDDEGVDPVAWVGALLQPIPATLRIVLPALLWLGALAGALALVAAWVLIAYNLLAPLFAGPVMSMNEALGVSMLLGLGVLILYLLKESKA